jgi:hypothetical protein
VTATASLVERFRVAFRANSGGVHGPFPAAAAGDVALGLARKRAGSRPVAVAAGDPGLGPFGLPARLEAAGAEVLLPGDVAWSTALAGAGAGVTGFGRACVISPSAGPADQAAGRSR